MFKVVTSTKFAPLLLIGALILVIGACSSDSDDTPVAATATAPAATEAPPPTTVPTVSPIETPEPTVITDPVRNPPNIKSLPVKQLPAVLNPDQAAEPVAEELATELWTEYLTDTIQEFGNKEVYFHFCEGGYIYSADGNEVDLNVNQPESWSVGRNAAMSSSRWWETNIYALVTYYTGGIEQDTIVTLGVENGIAVGANEPYDVYESEYCAQQAS